MSCPIFVVSPTYSQAQNTPHGQFRQHTARPPYPPWSEYKTWVGHGGYTPIPPMTHPGFVVATLGNPNQITWSCYSVSLRTLTTRSAEIFLRFVPVKLPKVSMCFPNNANGAKHRESFGDLHSVLSYNTNGAKRRENFGDFIYSPRLTFSRNY